MMREDTLQTTLGRIQHIAALIGGLGMVALVSGALMSTRQFLQSYLFAYVFWIDFALGCLALFMLNHLVSGGWGFVIQRLVEAGMRTLPLMGLLFIPVLLGMSSLYSWVSPERVNAGHEVHIWNAYLNVPFFVARTIIYFVLWIGNSWILSRWSKEQDASTDPRPTQRILLLSAPGLLVYVLTVSFASVDWVMSLEPGWFSTIYGFMFVVGQVLGSLALVVVSLRLLAEYPPLSRIVTSRHLHHLGNLLLTFVILWAYMAYSQYIIIWSGNLPDENSWYLRRLAPGWSTLGLCIVIVHFFLPLVLLLFRRTKRSIGPLSAIAVVILFMRLADTFWVVSQAFSPDHFRLHWLDLLAPIAVGGVWIFVFAGQLKRRSLIPLHDPRFVVSLEPIKDALQQ